MQWQRANPSAEDPGLQGANLIRHAQQGGHKVPQDCMALSTHGAFCGFFCKSLDGGVACEKRESLMWSSNENKMKDMENRTVRT